METVRTCGHLAAHHVVFVSYIVENMVSQDSTSFTEQTAEAGTQYQFKNSKSLVKFITYLLYAYVFVLVINVISDLMEIQLLQKIAKHGFSGDAAMTGAAQANDLRQAIIGVCVLIFAIATFVLMLKWIYRANNNARALGAKGMRYTPGWCIGWFFIPIMGLWKPLSAMREIWKVSSHPSDWQKQPVSGIIGWWWGLFLISNILGQASFRIAMAATTNDQLQISAMLNVVCAPFDIALSLIFISLMIKITDMQQRHHEASAINPA